MIISRECTSAISCFLMKIMQQNNLLIYYEMTDYNKLYFTKAILFKII